jgi:HlyD family secretion protein
MPISLTCECGKQLKIKEELAGKRVKCPGCQEILMVPAYGTPNSAKAANAKNAAPPPEDTDEGQGVPSTPWSRLGSNGRDALPDRPRVLEANRQTKSPSVAPSTFGFPPSAAAPKPTVVARPTPLPKRPKGRWFIGVFLLASCAFAGHQVWDSFFRYQAYGTVTGRVIQLSPPWEGEIAFLHVREGDQVRQGQLLATLTNDDLRARIGQISDELHVAQATLEAETVKLKWQAAFQLEQPQTVAASYQEALGQLEVEKTTLARMQAELQRGKQLFNQKVISRQELDRLHYDSEGQRERIIKVEKALTEYKKRNDLAVLLLAKQGDLGNSFATDGLEQMKPYVARIDALHAERTRLEAKLARGKLLAPTNGLVVKIHRFPGERVGTNEPLLSLLEEGSLQVVLYMPQRTSQSLPVGDNVDVMCEPYSGALTCKVARLGQKFEPAPEHLKRHYATGQHLLPVYLEPAPEAARWLALRIGGTVKLPGQNR